ncbi:MAG: type II toxin-antitoxin system prevent-host-death family antitoxin [Stellaceae bacterium]
MDETVSAAEANRAFSRLLRGVRAGRSYLVTAHGRAVARLVPASEGDQGGREVRGAARRVLIERVLEQPAINIGSWSRDELYER